MSTTQVTMIGENDVTWGVPLSSGTTITDPTKTTENTFSLGNVGRMQSFSAKSTPGFRDGVDDEKGVPVTDILGPEDASYSLTLVARNQPNKPKAGMPIVVVDGSDTYSGVITEATLDRQNKGKATWNITFETKGAVDYTQVVLIPANVEG